jgi:hypothetical protein
MEESAKRGQAKVSRDRKVMARNLDILQKGQYPISLQVLHSQSGGGLSGTPDHEGEKQLEGITVSEDGVGAQCPLAGQVVLEEGLNEVKKLLRVAHVHLRDLPIPPG